MNEILKTDVDSEIGELEGVILHTPGEEIENMTPSNAAKSLYSDILNNSIASTEYVQLKSVLEKVTKTFQVKTLLEESFKDSTIKTDLVKEICENEHVTDMQEYLLDLTNDKLAKVLIEGAHLQVDNLTKFFSGERYALKPLPNFFFTRDASMSFNDKVLIGKMASNVRDRESLIMEQIFTNHNVIETNVLNPTKSKFFNNKITIEGGDFLVAREDVLCIGNGERTTTQGIDFLIQFFKENKIDKHLIIQQLPSLPESFIHLDMVFTFLDKNKCMVYAPLILEPNQYKTVHISIKDGKVEFIQQQDNILKALRNLGIDLEPLMCGGRTDQWLQEREQWHSGANFFCLAPGKIIGYGRNVNTIEDLNNNGFEVIPALDVINSKINLDDYKNNNYVVTIDGSELSRGGGGCRCMTMPIKRKKIIW